MSTHKTNSECCSKCQYWIESIPGKRIPICKNAACANCHAYLCHTPQESQEKRGLIAQELTGAAMDGHTEALDKVFGYPPKTPEAVDVEKECICAMKHKGVCADSKTEIGKIVSEFDKVFFSPFWSPRRKKKVLDFFLPKLTALTATPPETVNYVNADNPKDSGTIGITPTVEVSRWEKEFERVYASSYRGKIAPVSVIKDFIRKLQAATAASEREAGRREALAEVEEKMRSRAALMRYTAFTGLIDEIAALKEISHKQK